MKKSSAALPAGKVAALYVRVSTSYQVDKCSLPFQKKELSAYCEHVLHLSGYQIYEDAGRSGKNTDRPGFQRMLTDIHVGKISHVLVYKIDRISRNLVDFSMMYDDFKKHGVTFVSLNEQFDTSSAIGEAVLKIILVFAELERKLTSERVTDVMIGRAKEGLWNGAHVPLGWMWDPDQKKPVHHPQEAALVKQIYAMYQETHSTVYICHYLNTHGIPSKRGGAWTTRTVSCVLRNPINRGDYRYNYRSSARGAQKPDDEVVYLKGVFPPLVDPEVFDACIAQLDANTFGRNAEGRIIRATYVHIFRGLVHCAVCGSVCYCMKDEPRENGYAPTYYQCSHYRNKRTCTQSRNVSDLYLGGLLFPLLQTLAAIARDRKAILSADQLEKRLLSSPALADVAGIELADLEALLAVLRSPGPGLHYKPAAPASSPAAPAVPDLDDEETKLSRALDRLKKLYLFADAGMSEREYLPTRRALEAQLVEIRNRRAAAALPDPEDSTPDLSFLQSASAFLISHHLQAESPVDFLTVAAAVDKETLRDFIRTVVSDIRISDGRVQAITFVNGITLHFLRR